MNETTKKSFTLLDYYEVFKKNKKFILIITAGILIIVTFLYFVIIDPLFLSECTVKSTSKSSALSGMLSASGLASIGDLSDVAGSGVGATELALYENILTSRRCIEDAINKFGLFEENNEKYMQDAVKNFKEKYLEITKDKLAGTLTIGVYNKNPQKAKEIVEFFVKQLNEINIDLNVQNAKNNREFVESRYKQIKADLTRAEDSLKQYQDKFGVAPDVSVKASVQSDILLEGDIKSEEIKLELYKKMLAPDQYEVKLQEDKIKAMKNKLDELRNSDKNGDYLKLKDSPEIVINFLRLQRDVEIQSKILAFILPILEQAKIDEKKEMPVVLILDKPYLPEKKAKPKRLLMILIFTLAGFGLTYSAFFLKDKFNEYLNRTNE